LQRARSVTAEASPIADFGGRKPFSVFSPTATFAAILTARLFPA